MAAAQPRRPSGRARDLRPSPVAAALLGSLLLAPPSPGAEVRGSSPEPEPLEVTAPDGVRVRADVFSNREEDAGGARRRPVFVALHGAGWNRAQWRPLVPFLLEAGFDVVLPDLRCGAERGGVRNETARAAHRLDAGRTPLHARLDVAAVLERLRADGRSPIVLAGTSLSAALALLVAAERPDLADAVVALSPYEAFARFGRPAPYLAHRISALDVPVFLTGQKAEMPRVRRFLEALPEGRGRLFEPPVHGGVGIEALAGRAPDCAEARQALVDFLRRDVLGEERSGKAKR